MRLRIGGKRARVVALLVSLIGMSLVPLVHGGAAEAATTPTGARIVQVATAIKDGQGAGVWRGAVPYVWGGGHKAWVGPSTGTCVGYTGSITPCPALRTVGVDCSGLTRWVYRIAYGRDVLGNGNTNSQIARMRRVSVPQQGDLVFYGSSRTTTHHVGIYIGGGRMINAFRTGTIVRIDPVTAVRDRLGYYRL